ncbi:bifunctional adenosylcobinamide kinase/adenosylcobinamide-phosphate guanylyltransferase, partial [Vibrio fortis]
MNHTKTTHLILGGARSGKSSFAEKQAIEKSSNDAFQLHYIATATS